MTRASKVRHWRFQIQTLSPELRQYPNWPQGLRKDRAQDTPIGVCKSQPEAAELLNVGVTSLKRAALILEHGSVWSTIRVVIKNHRQRTVTVIGQ